jgi:hypothetical protein
MVRETGTITRVAAIESVRLSRNLLIPKRLIFESRVRVGSPSFAAAPQALRFGCGFLPARRQ